MRELTGLYALWLREFKVFQRERSRLASALFTPLLWLFIFGTGVGAKVSIAGMDYRTFIFPGVLSMAVLFTSLFFGVYIVWDRKIDFLKAVMVAPLSRTTIFLGKVLGGMTDSLLESVVVLAFGLLIGISYSLSSLAAAYLFIVLLAVGMVSLGLIIGSFMESLEGFGMVVSFVAFPMFFLSGALFQVEDLPAWLSFLVLLDPVTYAVDGLRGTLLGVQRFPLALDLIVLVLFSASVVAAGTQAFKRMKV
ncbi:MAG: ABC transporter permease [Candidatus Hydrothermarchaeota archaeon]|nr:ABC transporter permease [Candidatus Hydrothermarchaeota archaeon]